MTSMSVDATVSSDGSNAEVMASVDSSPARPTFIIADVTRDEAWISMGVDDAPALDDWR